MKNKFDYVPPKNDIQALATYDWTYNYTLKIDQEFLDMNTCKLICKDIYKAFGIPFKNMPKIIPDFDSYASYYYPAKNLITLEEEMRFRPFLLHEIAHSLVHHFYGGSKPNHGPHFMGLYLIILNKWCKVPMSELIRTVKLNNIEYKFARHPRKGFRAKPSLTNKINSEIKLPKIKFSGIRVREPNPKGGYQLKYYYDW
jgi:hypothetical protein